LLVVAVVATLKADRAAVLVGYFKTQKQRALGHILLWLALGALAEQVTLEEMVAIHPYLETPLLEVAVEMAAEKREVFKEDKMEVQAAGARLLLPLCLVRRDKEQRGREIMVVGAGT